MKRIAICCAVLLMPMTAWAQPMVTPTVPVMGVMAPKPVPKPVMAAAPVMKVATTPLTAPVTTAKPASMAPVGVAMAPEETAGKIAPLPLAAKLEKKATDPWWKVILGALSKAGLAFASALLPILIWAAVTWLKAKFKLESTAGLDDTLNKWVALGIEYAEQQATKLDDNPAPNATKLKMATEFVLKMVASAGLPEKVADLVEDRIEARLKSVKNGSST